MPPVSEKQRKFMRYAAKDPEGSGVPKSVSKEFNSSDKGGKLPEKKSRAGKRYDKGKKD